MLGFCILFFFHLQNITFNFWMTYFKKSKAKLGKHASVSTKRHQFTSTGHRLSRTVFFWSAPTNQHLTVVLAFIKYPTKKLAFQGKAGMKGKLAYLTRKATQSWTKSHLFRKGLGITAVTGKKVARGRVLPSTWCTPNSLQASTTCYADSWVTSYSDTGPVLQWNG